MKVFLDATKCAGYGTCAEICPSLFQLDEFGYASVIGNGDVPDAEQEKALEAVSRCPEKAITKA